MLGITELTGIGASRTERIRESLDRLLRDHLISGYNWFAVQPTTERIVTFSHMHEIPEYKAAMTQDLLVLGYGIDEVDRCTRAKYGSFRWERHFVHRDDDGSLFPNLRVRSCDGAYIELDRVPEQTLEHRSDLAGTSLIGESEGWELDLDFKNREHLISLASLFVNKSNRKNNAHWPGAYDVPVLLFGQSAVTYAADLPDFVVAKHIILTDAGNEISFVVNKHFPLLSARNEFSVLQSEGFRVESCLGNASFIERYVDNE
ncbi:hypothetical protein HY493_04470 [Candidatus Woesearchaeota archaeon]|nr:hypothetical protein [Candidatus Woesearchaeota archaeon]